MSTLLEDRIESPFRPMDDAQLPAEQASVNTDPKILTDAVPGVTNLEEGTSEADSPEAVPEKDSPSDDGKGLKNTEPAEDGGTGSGEAGAEEVKLTEDMLKEEEKMHEISEQEEKEMQKKRDEALMNLNDEISQQRYRRLEFLLNKSSMYTQFLLKRIENQKAEEARKAELTRKRLAKTAERKEKEFEKKKLERLRGVKATEESPAKTDEKEEKDVESESKPNDVDHKPEAEPEPVKIAPIFAPRRSGRRSEGKTEPEPKAEIKKRGNRGRKRKVEKITDFIDEEELRKRARLQSEQEEAESACGKKVKSDGSETVKESKITEKVGGGVDDVDGGKLLTETETGLDETDKAAIYNEALKTTARVINGEVAPEEQPALFTGGVLRRYQVDGYMWLRCLYENGINGILADEMGLGKTIQCIAAVSHLVNMGVVGPYLVVAPLSTIPNWVSEFQRFAPKVPVILYHGSADQREILRKKIRKAVKIRGDIVSYPVVVTSYEVTMNDRKYLGDYPWKYLIIDEGHRIKNFQCKLIKELKMYKTTHRLLLTGTPLQNNLAELWSLLNFLLPEIFDDLGSFESWFDIDAIAVEGADEKIVAEERQKNILTMLHQILTPFMLRRLKTDVDLVIPPKREMLVYAPLAQEQTRYYSMAVDKSIRYLVEEKEEDVTQKEYDERGRPKRAAKENIDYKIMLETETEARHRENETKFRITEREEAEFEAWVNKVSEFTANRNTSKSNAPEIKKSEIHLQMRNMMMLLRRICNHPYLVEYPLNGAGQYRVDEDLISSCGKMMLLDKMLVKLKQEGHKVLIFSQMTSMLDILEDFCYLRDYKFSRLDGSRSVLDRKEQMENFNNNKDVFLFLLSTRAGGLGINLTAADTVIIYDSDWNPQADLQAQDRCHRIGQTVPVLVFRLVTAKTIDQKIVERAATKRKLEKMVIHKGRFKKGMKGITEKFNTLDPKELLELLKSRDYQDVIDGHSKSGGHDVISNRILNRLLDRQELYDIWLDKMDDEKEAAKIRSRRGRSVADVAADEGLEGVYKVIDSELGRSAFDEEGKEKEADNQ